MKKTRENGRPRVAEPRPLPLLPVADADRLRLGLALESGEALPRPERRLH
jgi:hypothetical protein